MIIHLGIDLLLPEWTSATVCIGTFDGVHLGHQALIREAVRQARENEEPAIVVTFDRHPLAILAPDRCPPSLASQEQNLAVFASLGASMAVVLPFDLAMSQTPAGDFLQNVLIAKLRATRLVVGHDFAMGRGREGATDWLAARIPTTVLEAVQAEGHRVSSSEIRQLVASGGVAHAAVLLGRAYALSGVVVGGEKLGRQLGYPTINLARTVDQVTPADGIYAGRCRTPLGEFQAAISIGRRPTVAKDGPRTVEAFLLDYPGDSLYGAPVELSFLTKLRDELKFDSLEALKKQMALDVAACRAQV
jgi:riboflavin kinase/FMN adenylyltransferase